MAAPVKSGDDDGGGDGDAADGRGTVVVTNDGHGTAVVTNIHVD